MGKIDYCDPPQFNPIVGCRGEGCEVRRRNKCWALWQAKRQRQNCELCYSFTPHLHRERLLDPLKRVKPARICTNFMGDLFDYAITDETIQSILNIIEKANWHHFLCLTKQPQRTVFFNYPRNLWLGTSVNIQKDASRINHLLWSPNVFKWISFEPLYEPIQCELEGIGWVVIGAQTHPHLAVKKSWMEKIVQEAKYHNIPIFYKRNLRMIQ